MNNFQTIMKTTRVLLWSTWKSEPLHWSLLTYIFSFSCEKLCITTLLLGNNEVENDCEQTTTRKIEGYIGLYRLSRWRGLKIFFLNEKMETSCSIISFKKIPYHLVVDIYFVNICLQIFWELPIRHTALPPKQNCWLPELSV